MNRTVWLGPAADQLTAEQLDRFEYEAKRVLARVGDDPGDQPDRDTALSAVVQYLLGEIAIDQAGADRVRTRTAERAASLVAQQVARMAVLDGMPEAEAARRAGLDRMTVRAALGKR
ncbi:MAG: hypothetical protein ACRDP1_02410 [Nocardioidaceae bacterium]